MSPPAAPPAPVHLCGRRLDDARHVCAFVHGRDEEYEILAPFVKEGASQGERLVQVMNDAHIPDNKERLRKVGVDADALEARGQLAMVRWHDTYLADGHFDGDRMLGMIEGLLTERRAKGFPQMRVMGNMEWALRGSPGTEQLLEYETRVNLMNHHPDVFVCVYDVDKFPANTLFDVMRTHPAVVLGGVYHENPYFVPPEQMLRELVARGKAKRA